MSKVKKQPAKTTKSPEKLQQEDAPPRIVYNDHEKKKQALITRTIWSLVMLVGFLVVLASGHLPLIGFVILCQILTFREIIALTAEPARDKNIPWNKSLNWYFLLCTVYYYDGESVFELLQEEILSSNALFFFYKNHKFIAYSLYIAGFIAFVFTLKKGFYKFQFASLCATHMTLLLVVFQSHLIIENILNGIIWLLIPASLVVVNDIFAYLCGITFGRTQLIEISPKKTVEGFLGAWVCTGLAAVFVAWLLAQSDYLICPATNFHTTVYNYQHCEPNPVFIPQIYQLPDNIAAYVGRSTITFKPLYIHSAVIATFASLIAPFGGFFASGLKRAFGIKDFGDTIPGHGGITDRFDCQFLMGSFSYLYFQTFISSSNINFGKVLQMAVFNLATAEIFQLTKSLLKYLHTLGSLSEEKLKAILDILA